MPYKNPKDLLLDAVKYPTAIESKLPEGAPKVSTMLTDATGKVPELPDFLMEIPDLPAPLELPGLTPPGGEGAGLKRYVSGVEVTPVEAEPTKREVIPSPAVGVIPERKTRRGM